MLVSVGSMLFNYVRGKKVKQDPDDYYKTIYGFHVHKVTFVLGLAFLTGSALTTGTVAHMAEAQALIITKGVEICSQLLLLCGNRFDVPFLYMPYLIVFTFNSVIQLVYAAYLYATATQLISHGRGLMDHWDQFRQHPELAIQASATLLSQTLSGVYFLCIVFRSWQFMRTQPVPVGRRVLAIKNE